MPLEINHHTVSTSFERSEQWSETLNYAWAQQIFHKHQTHMKSAHFTSYRAQCAICYAPICMFNYSFKTELRRPVRQKSLQKLKGTVSIRTLKTTTYLPLLPLNHQVLRYPKALILSKKLKGTFRKTQAKKSYFIFDTEPFYDSKNNRIQSTDIVNK